MRLLLCLLPLLCIGCSEQARVDTLKPAIQKAWVSLRPDTDPNYVPYMDKAAATCDCPDLPVIWTNAKRHITLQGTITIVAEKQLTMDLLDSATELYCREAGYGY